MHAAGYMKLTCSESCKAPACLETPEEGAGWQQASPGELKTSADTSENEMSCRLFGSELPMSNAEGYCATCTSGKAPPSPKWLDARGKSPCLALYRGTRTTFFSAVFLAGLDVCTATICCAHGRGSGRVFITASYESRVPEPSKQTRCAKVQQLLRCFVQEFIAYNVY